MIGGDWSRLAAHDSEAALGGDPAVTGGIRTGISPASVWSARHADRYSVTIVTSFPICSSIYMYIIIITTIVTVVTW